MKPVRPSRCFKHRYPTPPGQHSPWTSTSTSNLTSPNGAFVLYPTPATDHIFSPPSPPALRKDTPCDRGAWKRPGSSFPSQTNSSKFCQFHLPSISPSPSLLPPPGRQTQLPNSSPCISKPLFIGVPSQRPPLLHVSSDNSDDNSDLCRPLWWPQKAFQHFKCS